MILWSVRAKQELVSIPKHVLLPSATSELHSPVPACPCVGPHMLSTSGGASLMQPCLYLFFGSLIVMDWNILLSSVKFSHLIIPCTNHSH